jgi:hypothetical protein
MHPEPVCRIAAYRLFKAVINFPGDSFNAFAMPFMQERNLLPDLNGPAARGDTIANHWE